MTDHTITAFDDELQTLESEVDRLGVVVLEQVERLEMLLKGNNLNDAETIVRTQGQVLRLQKDTEEFAVRTLAKRQPVANDLRSVIMSMRVVRELGDISYAASEIASLLLNLSGLPMIAMPANLGQMADFLVLQTKSVIFAYETKDAELSREIWFKDQECDRLHNVAFLEIVGLMARDPRAMRQSICCSMLAKNLERIGDHCAHIADSICYGATGERLATPRPKDDQTSTIAM